MPTIDPYRVLQVHPEADAEIIGVAYRKLAQRYHPDVTVDPAAAGRMAELNAARDLLLDPAARAAYDRRRRAAGDGPVAVEDHPGSTAASPRAPADGVAGHRPGTRREAS